MASELNIEVVTESPTGASRPYIFHCPYCKKDTTLSIVETVYTIREVYTLTEDKEGYPQHTSKDKMSAGRIDYPETISNYICTNCERQIHINLGDMYFYNIVRFKTANNKINET